MITIIVFSLIVSCTRHSDYEENNLIAGKNISDLTDYIDWHY